MIWNRFVASQMASCILDSTSIEINNGEYSLKATGSTVKFDGFTKIYNNDNDEDEKSYKDA